MGNCFISCDGSVQQSEWSNTSEENGQASHDTNQNGSQQPKSTLQKRKRETVAISLSTTQHSSDKEYEEDEVLGGGSINQSLSLLPVAGSLGSSVGSCASSSPPVSASSPRAKLPTGLLEEALVRLREFKPQSSYDLLDEYVPVDEHKRMFAEMILSRCPLVVDVVGHTAFYRRFMNAATIAFFMPEAKKDQPLFKCVCTGSMESKSSIELCAAKFLFCLFHACMSEEWHMAIKEETDMPLCVRQVCVELGDITSKLRDSMYRNVRVDAQGRVIPAAMAVLADAAPGSRASTPWVCGAVGGGKRDKITVEAATKDHMKARHELEMRRSVTNTLAAIYLLCEKLCEKQTKQQPQSQSQPQQQQQPSPQPSRGASQEAFHYVAWSLVSATYREPAAVEKLGVLEKRMLENSLPFIVGAQVLQVVLKKLDPASKGLHRIKAVPSEDMKVLEDEFDKLKQNLGAQIGLPVESVIDDANAVIFSEGSADRMQWRFETTEVISVGTLCQRLESCPEFTPDLLRVRRQLSIWSKKSHMLDAVVLVFPAHIRLHRVRQMVEAAFRIAPFLAAGTLELPLLVDAPREFGGPCLLVSCKMLFALRVVLTGYMAERNFRLSGRIVMYPLLARMWFCEPMLTVPVSAVEAALTPVPSSAPPPAAAQKNWLHSVSKYVVLRTLVRWMSTRQSSLYILNPDDPRFVMYDMLPMIMSRWGRYVDVQKEVEYELRLESKDYDEEEMLELVSVKPSVCYYSAEAYAKRRENAIAFYAWHRRKYGGRDEITNKPIPIQVPEPDRINRDASASTCTIRSLFGILLDFINISAPRMVLTYYLRRVYLALTCDKRANGKDSRVHFAQDLPQRMRAEFFELYTFILEVEYKSTDRGFVPYTRLEFPQAPHSAFSQCWPTHDLAERNRLLACSFYAFLCSDLVDDIMARRLLHSICMTSYVNETSVSLALNNQKRTLSSQLVDILSHYSHTTLGLFPRSAEGVGVDNLKERMKATWLPEGSQPIDSVEFNRRYVHNMSYVRVETSDNERRFYCYHIAKFMQCLEWCITYYNGPGMAEAREKMRDSRLARMSSRARRQPQEPCTPREEGYAPLETEAENLFQRAMCVEVGEAKTTPKNTDSSDSAHAARLFNGPCQFDTQRMLDEVHGTALPVVMSRDTFGKLRLSYLENGIFIPSEVTTTKIADDTAPSLQTPSPSLTSSPLLPSYSSPLSVSTPASPFQHSPRLPSPSLSYQQINGGPLSLQQRLPELDAVYNPSLLDALAYYYTTHLNSPVDCEFLASNNLFTSTVLFSERVMYKEKKRKMRDSRNQKFSRCQEEVTPQLFQQLLKVHKIQQYGSWPQLDQCVLSIRSSFSHIMVTPQQQCVIPATTSTST